MTEKRTDLIINSHTKKSDIKRRTILKSAWATPIVAAVSLPVHAGTSDTTTEAPSTTPPPPTTTVAPTTTANTTEPTTTVVPTTASPTTTEAPVTTLAPTTPVPTTTGMCPPGELNVELAVTPNAIANANDTVVVTLTVTNPSATRVGGLTVSLTEDRGNGPMSVALTLIGGDVNNDGFLDPGEMFVYQYINSYVWSSQTVVSFQAEVTGEDNCDNALSKNGTGSLFLSGINMAILANQETANPGDEIEITLVSRLYVGQVDDAQWANFKYRCNLLGDEWRKGGPNDEFWANAADDYVSNTPGAKKLALDMNEAQTHGDHPNWIHKFIYKVPADQSTDLEITAADIGDLRVYQDGKWHTGDEPAVGQDKLVIPLGSGLKNTK